MNPAGIDELTSKLHGIVVAGSRGGLRHSPLTIGRVRQRRPRGHQFHRPFHGEQGDDVAGDGTKETAARDRQHEGVQGGAAGDGGLHRRGVGDA